MKKLYRSKKDRMLFGVCGGVAEYWGVDPALVRILWIYFTLLGIAPGVIAYLAAWLMVPEEAP